MAKSSKPASASTATQGRQGKAPPKAASLPKASGKKSVSAAIKPARPAPKPAKAASKPAPSKRKAPPKAVARKNAKPKASHGGSRAGAGRPKGTGKLGERTSSMRTTPALHEKLLAIRNAMIAGSPLPGSAVELELYEAQVAAGFGVPADETASRRVDLYTLFSPKPESTFLVKVAGWSMRGAGIHDGDYLLVDRSIEARTGHVVVAHVEGQGLVAKRLRIDADGAFLDSENPDFKPIALGEGSQAKVWGVARAKAGLL